MVNIAVIGGGPAGFMAAVCAAENSSGKAKIDILEQGIPLKTILRTGHGRCNITNATFNYKELASNYPRGEKFLYSVFSRFGVKDTIGWFKKHGVELYTQDDNRVFPRSDDANTVREALISNAKKTGINIKEHTQVIDVTQKGDKFIINTGNHPIEYEKVIISTGGDYRKHPNTGYDFAKKLGHKITELKPALTALWVKEIWPADLAGVTIQNAQITLFFENRQVARVKDDFVFTHKGISGPLAFKISSYAAFLNYDECNPLMLYINFVPDMKQEELEKDLLNELDENSKKSIVNVISKYVPKSVAAILLGIELIDPEKKVSQVSREDRKTIIKLLTQAQLSVKFPQPEGEIITAGGVELDEVNSKTMESKLVNNLYFCGEVLNIDGFTGGYNLQAAWSTGYIAGVSAVS